jgi:hypothetical protein
MDECDADVVAGDMERRGRGTAAVDAAVTTLVSTDVPGALRMADRKLATRGSASHPSWPSTAPRSTPTAKKTATRNPTKRRLQRRKCWMH